jgi:hypothetical protein
MEETVTTTSGTYHTEIIDLPSKGAFYPETSPLRNGQIELYHMTAKHEDILTSTNLIQKGLVLDKLFDALIATKGVKSADLLVGDLNAVMVAARILGYGKDYPIEVACPKCKNIVEHVVDLTTLNTVDGVTSVQEITLPLSGAKIKLRFLTRADEFAIEKEVKALAKLQTETGHDNTARLRAIIASVNGDSSAQAIYRFVDSLLVKDSRFLKAEYKKMMPDVDFNVPVSCECSDEEFSVRLPISAKFFWPDI